MKLLFEENFNGETLNEEIWNFAIGDLGVNEELQYYVKENYKIEDNTLKIFATKVDDKYYSTRISTYSNFSFQYGYVEFDAKLPKGFGSWPALWMLPDSIREGVEWPLCGEIDILEHVGCGEGELHYSLHSKTYNHKINTQITKIVSQENVTSQFNKYACRWDKDGIIFYFNGKKVAEFYKKDLLDQTVEGWPFDQKFHLICNLAVGGTFGGPIIDEDLLPFVFEVRNIKVFELEN